MFWFYLILIFTGIILIGRVVNTRRQNHINQLLANEDHWFKVMLQAQEAHDHDTAVKAQHQWLSASRKLAKM